jgi:putative heme-binding domain-containing protein
MQFGPEPSHALAHHLAGDGDAEIRAQAAVVLARYPGKEVGADLITLLNDPAPIVQRRAAEGLVRTQTRAPLDKLRPVLAGKDRLARFAARLTLERIDPGQWRHAVLKDKNPRVAIMGLIALNKLGVVSSDAKVAQAAFAREQSLLQADLPRNDLLDTLRCLQLTLINTKRKSRPQSVKAIGKAVLARFPTGERPLDYELARLLAALGVPGAIDKMLDALAKHSKTEDLALRADAIHYARCLVAVTEGWTRAQRRRYLAWFKKARTWNGGFSYRSTIYYFLRDAAARAPQAEKGEWKAEMDKWPRNPFGAGGPIVESKKTEPGWTYDKLLTFLEGKGRKGSVAAGRKIYEKANCAKCHRFEQIGSGLGPDLTTLSSRFKRKDTLDAIVYPSRVIADQYKSWLITLKNGQVIHGMKAPDEGDQLVLLLADATVVKLPKAAVEEKVESKQSIMPEGLLNEFKLQEIADLFAFLESGKGTPAQAAKASK